MTRALIAMAVSTVLLAGCASRGSLRQIEKDLSALRTHGDELRYSQQVTGSELARIAGELRALEARTVELQAAMRERSADITRLRARLDAAEQELRDAKTQIASQARGRARAPASEEAPAAPGSSPTRPGAPEPDEAERAYNTAMANFRVREHGQAVLDFLDFIARYQTHPLAPSAQYWIGEAYFGQRDYRQALVELQRVVDMAPASRNAADALVKVRLAHTNLRENSRAQQAWQRVVHDYPATDAAGKARELLRAHAARRP